MQTQKNHHFILRAVVAIGSFFLWLLSFKAVRNWVWKRVERKGQEKIVDAQAKIVRGADKR